MNSPNTKRVTGPRAAPGHDGNSPLSLGEHAWILDVLILRPIFMLACVHQLLDKMCLWTTSIADGAVFLGMDPALQQAAQCPHWLIGDS